MYKYLYVQIFLLIIIETVLKYVILLTRYIGKTALKSGGNTQPGNASNQNIIWSSSNENVATVNNRGTVTGVSAGTAIITATTEEGNFTTRATITVVP